MKALYTILAGLLLAAGSLSVTAQAGDYSKSQSGTGDILFDTFDKNNDGKLNKEEAKQAGLADRMKKLDDNGDGALTKREFARFERRHTIQDPQ